MVDVRGLVGEAWVYMFSEVPGPDVTVTKPRNRRT